MTSPAALSVSPSKYAKIQTRRSAWKICDFNRFSDWAHRLLSYLTSRLWIRSFWKVELSKSALKMSLTPRSLSSSCVRRSSMIGWPSSMTSLKSPERNPKDWKASIKCMLHPLHGRSRVVTRGKQICWALVARARAGASGPPPEGRRVGLVSPPAISGSR